MLSLLSIFRWSGEQIARIHRVGIERHRCRQSDQDRQAGGYQEDGRLRGVSVAYLGVILLALLRLLTTI